MSTIRRICAILLTVCLFLAGTFGFCRSISVRRAYSIPALEQETLTQLPLDSVQNVMIVAHPDDETLWGSGHLASGGWLVVCLTNGNNPTRSQEFLAVMKASGNVGLMLSYPDKVMGLRDDWHATYDQMQKDIETVLTCQPWDTIVTHNAAGEYGHQHHKMTHTLVTDAYDQNNLTSPLFVFGKYYKAADLLEHPDNELPTLSDDALAQKEQLLTLYVSQSHTVQKLSHMNPYENWEQLRGNTP